MSAILNLLHWVYSGTHLLWTHYERLLLTRYLLLRNTAMWACLIWCDGGRDGKMVLVWKIYLKYLSHRKLFSLRCTVWQDLGHLDSSICSNIKLALKHHILVTSMDGRLLPTLLSICTLSNTIASSKNVSHVATNILPLNQLLNLSYKYLTMLFCWSALQELWKNILHTVFIKINTIALIDAHPFIVKLLAHKNRWNRLFLYQNA